MPGAQYCLSRCRPVNRPGPTQSHIPAPAALWPQERRQVNAGPEGTKAWRRCLGTDTEPSCAHRFDAFDYWCPNSSPAARCCGEGPPAQRACGLTLCNGKGRPENSASGLPVATLSSRCDFRNDLRKSSEPRKANAIGMVNTPKAWAERIGSRPVLADPEWTTPCFGVVGRNTSRRPRPEGAYFSVLGPGPADRSARQIPEHRHFESSVTS